MQILIYFIKRRIKDVSRYGKTSQWIGGGGTLTYDGYEAYISSGTRVPSYTISGNHDAIQIIITGVTPTTFTPVHNNITYNWRLNRSGSSSGNGGSVVIPNVKDGDVITFTNNTAGGVQGVGFFGLSYT